MTDPHGRADRVEQRRYVRAPVNSPASFSVKGETDAREGTCRDISLGGMFLETDAHLRFNTEVTVRVALPGAKGEFALPGVVRWIGDGGVGIQFGMLGAHETHAITELGRKYGVGS